MWGFLPSTCLPRPASPTSMLDVAPSCASRRAHACRGCESDPAAYAPAGGTRRGSRGTNVSRPAVGYRSRRIIQRTTLLTAGSAYGLAEIGVGDARFARFIRARFRPMVAAGVRGVTDQLFPLGIDRDDQLAGGLERHRLRFDMLVARPAGRNGVAIGIMVSLSRPRDRRGPSDRLGPSDRRGPCDHVAVVVEASEPWQARTLSDPSSRGRSWHTRSPCPVAPMQPNGRVPAPAGYVAGATGSPRGARRKPGH